LLDARVSITRHGEIDTDDGVTCALVAPAHDTPPTPATTAIAAPIAAQRDRQALRRC
jgi:hypothetical protein